jgi:hypothetical protein
LLSEGFVDGEDESRERERGREEQSRRRERKGKNVSASGDLDTGLYEPCGFYLGLDPVSVGSSMGFVRFCGE